jgi:mRNA-degrading endonuclease YafQ of YafQ-DinJ toxin-antitoxin module
MVFPCGISKKPEGSTAQRGVVSVISNKGDPFVPIMLLVANHALLEPEWLNHSQQGGGKSPWMSSRGDFLLICQLDANWINFVRVGIHSELFGN